MWAETKVIQSSNELVKKYVFTKDDAVAEAVLYKYPKYKDRTVICCSTQSGCSVGCRFCGTGDFFVRSLSTEEIVSQSIRLFEDVMKEEPDILSVDDINRLQIMFMSMGEPLMNLKNVIPALHELYNKYPTARLLISTIGPKGINYQWLMDTAGKIETIGLQFSIHESTDEARDKLIPFKNKLTLKEIAYEGKEFFWVTGRNPFFNYCVHKDNNTQQDAANLAKLFLPSIWQATISVICERNERVSAANERQRSLASDFQQKLNDIGYSTRMFDPAGQDDIGGGCGQLWYVQDWAKQHPELARPSVGFGLPVVHTPQLELV